jgi:PhoPQ-activated pathogenicity-related protein
MTSQQWYNETLSNRPIWSHFVTVHIPNVNRFPDSAFLFIGKGRNTDGPPTINDGQIREMGQFAVSAGIITGHVKTIPNQPIIMENDGVLREEDEYIAWTWRRFFDEQQLGIDNPQILARMPMCKGSVRAMDAMQEFVKGKVNVDIEHFMIAGQSKRGWTVWLTAAIDDRVIAMAPVVLSCVNMVENFHHYWKSMGGWSFAMYDYWMEGLLGLMDEPEMTELAKIIDPYYYFDWLTMPKLMISGASDEFFMPDDYDYFYSDLKGQKYIWIMENSDHEVANGPLGADYWAMLETFYLGVLQNYEMPVMDWSRQYTESGGSIVLLSPTRPLNISAWSAISISPNRRDWRAAHIVDGQPALSNIVWVQSEVQDLGNGYYRADFSNPASGYRAGFIKVSYLGPEGRILYFTSQTAIVPDNFPYADCSGMACQGTLL